MIFQRKNKTTIDDRQIDLVDYARARIRQKKRLYFHFVAFLFASLVMVILNIGLGYGAQIQPFGFPWVLSAALLWVVFLLLHFFQIYVTKRFMNPAWEKEQIKTLVGLQETRIEKIKRKLDKEASLQADAEWHKEESEKPKQRITIIAAAASNHALGKDNKLIWHLSKDLQHFKTLTNGHAVIMGRKTFESMPRALPNRTNIVITRQSEYQAENITIASSLSEALTIAKDDPRPFIIGGGEIYKESMGIADEIELTRVHADFDADTFFPEINSHQWKEVWREEHAADEKHAHAFTFLRYQKI
ncbi:MAG: dihydrofolate reductase [Flavobacteriaceae bacterium]|nr:dihydrofolate reductase [Flavobacteriaceae bacterium]